IQPRTRISPTSARRRRWRAWWSTCWRTARRARARCTPMPSAPSRARAISSYSGRWRAMKSTRGAEMPLAKIPLSALTKKGVGLKRPEDVVVSREGRVWTSDEASACAEILSDGTLRRVGKAGGKPNGINMDREGRIIIANFALDTPDPGCLQRLDPRTGAIEVLCAEVAGRTLRASNYPLVDRAGNVWCSHSTYDRVRSSAGSGDGFVSRVRPAGNTEIMAEGFHFTNGLAMDADERHLYVCQTVGCDVVRLPIRPDGTLGPRERYGPLLGGPAIENPTVAERVTQGATDGCGFDQEGNLWVTLVRAN